VDLGYPEDKGEFTLYPTQKFLIEQHQSLSRNEKVVVLNNGFKRGIF